MNYSNDVRPEGSVTPETMDALTVGTTVWKVYPPRCGGYICKGVITRAPYQNRKTLWIDVDSDCGFIFKGSVSLGDAGVISATYNANRLFVKEEDANEYLYPKPPEQQMEIKGKMYSESTIHEALKAYVGE